MRISIVALIVLAAALSSHGDAESFQEANSAAPADPPPVTFTELAGGACHSVGRKSDGTAWGWGANFDGQVGDGTNTSRTSPVQVQKAGGGNLTEIIRVCAGSLHSFACQGDDSKLWSWGSNCLGQLGDGTTTDRNTAVKVKDASGGDFLFGLSISGGALHSLCAKQDGTVWTWGSNMRGQLGDGTNTDRSNPIQVGGVLRAVAVAAGYSHSLALRNDGTVWAWGANLDGQLGDGTLTERNIPVQVVNADGTPLSNIVRIAAGDWHSLALNVAGEVWTWGSNTSGQLGDGTTTNRSHPVMVTATGGGAFRDVVEIAGGMLHSLARRTDENSCCLVWAWGSNRDGQLGDGTTTDRSNPVQVLLAAGGGLEAWDLGRSPMAFYSLAVSTTATSGGTAWGQNETGQLGDGTTTNRPNPVDIR